MKLLFVSGYFPPHSPIAGHRAPALARFFLDAGLDVRILTPHIKRLPPLLSHDLPAERVLVTPYYDVMGPLNDGSVGRSITRRFAGWISQGIGAIPDPAAGWYGAARAEIPALLADWDPEVIYVSSPPMTGIRLGADIARWSGASMVVEYRDLWTEHPYFPYFRGAWWRAPLERVLERRWTAAVAAYVTVTEAWANRLRVRGKPVYLARNGFARLDSARGALGSSCLELCYAGSLYGEKRVPLALFKALAEAPDLSVKAHFYVDETAALRKAVGRAGVAQKVTVSGLRSHQEIKEIEAASDILLLPRWWGAAEAEVIPGKLFEYAGLGRPVLSMGRESGEAETLLLDHHLGRVAPDIQAIRRALEHWIREKRQTGHIAPVPPGARADLAQARQWAGLPAFLRSLL